ncbi:MAG TPA: discoidin domain-containing protein [Planctomycetota bacterium]|nr:discoidin domain-containing protein [Planctomycetota bacterium]
MTGSGRTNPCFERFEVVNALGLRTLFTAGRTVNVAITPVQGALSPTAGYVITESADVPGDGAAWSATLPTSYTIAGNPGTVSLWAWVKDGLGNVANATSWVVYSPNQIEIPKNQMTWQTSDGSNAAGAFNGDPLDTGWHGNSGGGVGGWLRITLANRYHIERFDYQPRTTHENGRIKDYEIYITDVNSTNKADWGAPVATGRFPNVTGGGPTIQVALNPARDGKYLILNAVNSYNYFGAAEVWAYGWAATNPGISRLDVFNAARDTSLFFGTLKLPPPSWASPTASTTSPDT